MKTIITLSDPTANTLWNEPTSTESAHGASGDVGLYSTVLLRDRCKERGTASDLAASGGRVIIHVILSLQNTDLFKQLVQC